MMSKFIIFFCIGLVASATHPKNTIRPRNNTKIMVRALKDRCIRGIQSVYAHVLNQREKKAADNPTIENIMAVDKVKAQLSFTLNDIIKIVHEAHSIGEISNHQLFTGVPLYCEEEIATEVLHAVTQLSVSSEIKVVRPA